VAIFREDEPGAVKAPNTRDFQSGSLMDTSTAASKAMREAAQRAMQAGSEVDDIAGLLGTIIGGAAAAATGVGIPAALSIGAAAGSAVQGATKMIEGKEAGGGKQLLSALPGVAKGAEMMDKSMSKPTAPTAPAPSLVEGEGPVGELYPDAKKKPQFDALLNLNPSFLRKK
jgi:hypothetical protein